MAYSTNEDLLLEYSAEELARLTGRPAGQPADYERIHYARANADAIIDAYLRGRYRVPLAPPVDPVISKISVDITIGNLYELAYCKTSIPSTVLWRRVNSVKLLKDIQQGWICIERNDAPAPSAPPPVISNKDASDRMFSEEDLDNFFRD